MDQLYTIIRFSASLALTVFLTGRGFTQVPTIQDCLGAIPVCQPVYSESNSTSGQGNYPNEINPFATCVSGEDNSVWYTFTVNESGKFGFLLTPNNSNDDYDWALFNITNASCGDIYSNSNLLVSCNAAGGNFGGIDCDAPTGATGGTTYDIQGGGCGSFPPTVGAGYTPENDLISVVEGNTYVLMVANWTGSPFGYTIDFGISDVGIFDFQTPEVTEVLFPEDCGDNELNIFFNENIRCASATSNSFQLSGPGGPYTINVNSENCDLGGVYDKAFTLTPNPPLNQSGTYTLSVCCVLDVCENELPAQDFTFDLILVDAPVVDLGPDTSFCTGTVLTYDVTSDQATYLWHDGSTDPIYDISTTGDYAVTVTNACGTSSDAITIVSIEFPPVTDLGPDEVLCTGETLNLDVFSEAATYLWNDGQTSNTFTINSEGTYGVSVTNACGTTVDEITIDYTPAIMVDLPSNLYPCSYEDVQLDVTNQIADYLWEDGSTDPVRPVETDGLYAVTVSNDCEEVEASVNIEFVPPPTIDLGNDEVLCDGELVVLDATFPGSSYVWQDGQTSATYEVSQGGQYSVTVENDCGSFTDNIEVSYVLDVAFDLGEDAYFCDGRVFLESGPTHDFAQYRWQDGSDASSFLVETPGTYWLQLDTGCEIETDSITFFPCEVCEVYMPNAFSPNNDGFNDFFHPYTPCGLENFNIQIYDRWGGHLYDGALEVPKGWDGTARGKNLPTGVYLWVVTFNATLNGETIFRQMEGAVNLIR